jgi:hypothetical protein
MSKLWQHFQMQKKTDKSLRGTKLWNGSRNSNCLLLFSTGIRESGNPWIRESVNPWIRESVNPWIRESVDPWIRGSVNPWIRESVNPWIRESVVPWIRESVNPWIRSPFLATGCSTTSTKNPCHHLPTLSLEHRTYPYVVLAHSHLCTWL